jgi:aspartyl-tRNA(Asn)/glutamyl-tRNA(Gln) amidotransferase subunit C
VEARVDTFRGAAGDGRVGEVAADDIPPTSHAVPLTNVFRDDEVRPGLAREDVLRGAPAAEENRFRVPRILGEEDGVSDNVSPAHAVRPGAGVLQNDSGAGVPQNDSGAGVPQNDSGAGVPQNTEEA